MSTYLWALAPISFAGLYLLWQHVLPSQNARRGAGGDGGDVGFLDGSDDGCDGGE